MQEEAEKVVKEIEQELPETLKEIADKALEKSVPNTIMAAPKIIKPKPSTVIIMLGIALVGILLILRAWHIGPFNTQVVTTQNSYVRGQITVISPQVSGYLVDVPVTDYQDVQEGDILAQIDQRIYIAKVQQAQAQVDYAQAQLNNLEQTLAQNQANLNAQHAQQQAYQAELNRAILDKRRTDQLAGNAISVKEQETANAQYQLAQANVAKGQAQIRIAQETIKATEVSRQGLQAQLEIAQAQLHLAQIDLDNTTIHAPSTGQISEVTARKGQYVTAGSQLMFLIPKKVWVVANFKETQTNQLRLGMTVTFTVDALDGEEFTGVIEEISPATGSEFSVIKSDNASGNFTKVVQRLPIKIAIEPNQPAFDRLRPGMSVVTTIDTAQSEKN